MWVYSPLKRMCLFKNFMIRDAPESQKVPWGGWGSRLYVSVLSSSYKKAKGPGKLKNIFLQSTVNCVVELDLKNSGRVSRLCVPLEDRNPLQPFCLLSLITPRINIWTNVAYSHWHITNTLLSGHSSFHSWYITFYGSRLMYNNKFLQLKLPAEEFHDPKR